MSSKAIKTVAENAIRSRPWRLAREEPSSNIDKDIFCQEIGISFASYLYLHGQEELAKNVCSQLKKLTGGGVVHRSSLIKAGELICNEDPSEVENVGKFLKTNLNIKYIAPIWHGRLIQLLNEEKPEEALQLCAGLAHSTGEEFGKFELYSDGFKRHDLMFTRKVFNLAEKIHGRQSAVGDIAFAMLMEGSNKLHSAALELLRAEKLRITGKKVQYLVAYGLSVKKYDAVNTFLVELLTTEHADFSDLIKSLEHVVKFYYGESLLTQISTLYKALESVNIVLPPDLRKYYENVTKYVDASEIKTSKKS